jgi:hypothetical protein
MAQILDLGKLRFNWKDVYSGSETYEYNDVVTYGPNVYAYVSAAATAGNVPTDTSRWQLVIEGFHFRGTYTVALTYYKNDLVTDGTSTYLVTAQHSGTGVTLGNTDLIIFALGQPGLPNQTGKINQLLTTDGSATSWTAQIDVNKIYAGSTQGQAAFDFESAGELTNVVAAFQKNATDFSQLAMINGSDGASTSTDFIAYTAIGTNNDGWIDMGITSLDFSASNFGITGPHDGYVFMSAPRGTTFDITKKKIVGSTATLTLGGAHGWSIGNKIRIEDVGGNFDGLKTLTGVTSTTVSFATTDSPLSEVTLLAFGTAFKPYGTGNLVLATDGTGLENAIVIAAGGYNSGRTQMKIWPDVTVGIAISTASTSPTTGALTVAGGAGIQGAVNIGGNLSVVGQVDFSGVDTLPIGPGATTFAATLTNPTVVAVTEHDNYAQIAHQNLSNAASASTDVIMYPDNGADGAGFIDMGITSSMFMDPAFTITGVNDGYIFMSAPVGTSGRGDLVLATDATGTRNAIVFAAGGYSSNRAQMVITPDQKVDINISTASVSPTTGALVVHGGVGITGDVNIAGNINFGGTGTNVSTANLAVNAPLIFTGSGSLVSTSDLGLVTEGKYAVTNIPTRKVVNKALGTNVATLTTDVAHTFLAGDSVTIANIDATFNGTYTIATVPSTTTFTYAKTNIDVASARIGDNVFSINNKVLTGNVATLTTSATHTYVNGNSVTVTGVDATFNGTYTITAVTGNTFSYAKTASNVTSAAVSPVGSAVVNTSTATAIVASGTRTRWSAFTKKNTDGVWNFVSNISTIPTTTINYAQNTYGNGVDVVYEKLQLGGLNIVGSGSSYGAPYGSLSISGNISSTAWTTAGIRHVGSGASTLTDTSSSGTVAVAYTNTFGSAITVAASNATTYTKYANSYFGLSTAGTNVTITNNYSVETAGAVLIGGKVDQVGDLNINTNKFNVTASTGALALAGDLTLATNKFTVASASGNTVVAGTLGVTGDATFSGNLTISGRLNVQEMREDLIDNTLSSNIATLDYNTGNIFYIGTAPSANWTVSLTNVPTDDGKVFTASIFQVQGATGYYPSVMNINGTGTTIKWAQGTTPTPTNSAGKIDVWNFTVIRRSGVYTVLGNFNFNF